MKKLTCLLILMTAAPELTGQDISGMASQKPFDIRGSLDVRVIGYSAKGMAARRSPFSYVLTGSPILSIYGIAVPLSFTYSEQQRSFSQPFNQFGMSPTYKWITVHGGYRNVSFSPYTLAGYTLLGAGVELKPGKFRLGFMTGRLNRATTIDTTTGALQPFSFSRHGYAAKIGYGTEGSHIDLSFLSARDSEKGFKGSLDSAAVRPAANVVVGTEARYTFAGKLYVFADAGLSIYTRDRHSALSVELDSVNRGLNFLNGLIPINGTSEYYLAYSGGMGYTAKTFGLKAAYKHVDPNFQSMGAYFFQNDLRSISLSPSFNALQGKLRFAGSIGVQEDNRKKQKQATTRRIISMANLSWDIHEKFGLDANYTNFSTNSEPTVTLVQNKYLLTQTNNNISVSPRLILVSKNYTHMVLFSYNLSNLSDLNEETQSTNNIRSSVALLNYNLGLNALGLSVNTGLNYTDNRLAMGTVSNKGFTLGLTKAFLKNKIMVSNSNSWIISSLPQGNSRILTLGGNVGYAPLKGHRVNLRVYSMNNAIEQEAAEPLKNSELTAELSYTLSF